MFFRNENTYPKKFLDKIQNFTKDFENWEWTDLVRWCQDIKSLIEKHLEEVLPVPLLLNLFKTISCCLRNDLAEGVQQKLFEVLATLAGNKDLMQRRLMITVLVTFFAVACKEIQVKVLNLLVSLCADSEKYPIDSIMAAVFKVIDEKGEVFEKVKEMVLMFLKNNEAKAYNSLWRVASSSSNKMPAMNILKTYKLTQSIFDENLKICALVSGLNDPNLRVRRLALDLIKVHFPILSLDVSRYDKLVLLKASLLTCDLREQTMLRRLWEWVFPHEMGQETDSISLIVDAFYEIRSEVSDKDIIIRTADLICGCEFGSQIFENISIELMIFIIYTKVNSSDLENLVNTLNEFKNVLLVKVLEQLENFLQMSEDLAYSMIFFIVKYNFHNGSFSFAVFEQLLFSIDYLENKLKLFEVLEKLSHCVNEIPSMSKFVLTAVEYLTRVNDPRSMQKIEEILKNFEKNSLNVSSFLLDVKKRIRINKDTEKYRLVEFLGNFKNPPISLIEMQFIWKKLLRKEEVFALILKISKHNNELINLGLLELISKSKIGFQAFLKFWDRASTSEITETLTSSIICVLISLIDENDELRPWMHSLDSKAYIVIDLLLVQLLDPVTTRVPANRIFIYENLFDKQSIIEKLSKLYKFLQNISNFAIESLLLQTLLPNLQSFLPVHKITADTYMQALVKSLVLYLVTQPFDEATLLASKSLEIVSKFLPQNLTFHLVRGGVRCLEHAIAQNNYTLQVSVMSLISPLLKNLFEEDYIRLYSRRVFTTCLLEGCFSKEAIIRRQWRQTIYKTLEMVCRYSSLESFSQYFDPLIKGISYNMVYYKDTSLISTMASIVKCLFRQNQRFLTQSFKFLESFIKISAEFLVISGSWYKNKHPIVKIKKTFFEVSQLYPQELVEAFVSLWSKYCLAKQDYLPVLMVLVSQFNMSLEVIFKCLLKILMKDLKNQNREVQVFISFLIYKLFSQTSIMEGFIKDYVELWTWTLELLTELLKSAYSEVPALIVKILSVVLMEDKFYSASTRAQRKILKEFVGKLFESVFSNIFNIKKQCISIPYPDFKDEVEIHELCLNYMIKHAYDVTLLACMKETKYSGLFLSNCCLNILFNLPLAAYGKKQAAGFILSVLKYQDLKISDKIKKNVLDLVFNETFIMNSADCLHEFSLIVSQVAKSYNDKKEILGKIEKGFDDSWFFIKKKSLESYKKKLSRICFLYFSSDVDEYLGFFDDIFKYLELALVEKQLFRHFCVLFKVSFVRFSMQEFMKIWKRFYGALVVRMVEIVQNCEDCLFVLDCLRLIEFFLCAEFEHIYDFLYVFLPDVQISWNGDERRAAPLFIEKFFVGKPNLELLDPNIEIKVFKSFISGSEDLDDFSDLSKLAISFTHIYRAYSTQLPSSPIPEINDQIEKEIHNLFIQS